MLFGAYLVHELVYMYTYFSSHSYSQLAGLAMQLRYMYSSTCTFIATLYKGRSSYACVGAPTYN